MLQEQKNILLTHHKQNFYLKIYSLLFLPDQIYFLLEKFKDKNL